MKIITFDLEIAKAVPDKNKPDREGYEYCKNWDDKAGMGISLGCAYLSWQDSYFFFDENNILEFIERIQIADLVTGFNIYGFDVPLLKATLKRLGHPEKTGLAGKGYDLFLDIKKSLGNYYPKGWTMDNVALGTLGEEKDGDSAEIPFLWQDGHTAQIATAVSSHVRMEHKAFLYALKHGRVDNAVTEPKFVNLTMIKDVEKKLRALQDQGAA